MTSNHLRLIRFAVVVLLAVPAFAQPLVRVRGLLAAPETDDYPVIVFTADGRAWVPVVDGVAAIDSGGQVTMIDDGLPAGELRERMIASLVVGSDGAVWGRSSFHVTRIDPVTLAVQRFPFPSGVRAIVAGPDGALWLITGSRTEGQLVRMSTTGAILSSATLSEPLPEYEVIGVTVAGGSMWLSAGSFSSRLRRIDADGTVHGITVPIPDAFWVLSGGDFLWVATVERSPSIVLRLSTTGEVLGSFTPLEGRLFGATVDAAGNLWMNEGGTNRIVRLMPDGVATTMAVVQPSIPCAYGIVRLAVTGENRLAVLHSALMPPIPDPACTPGSELLLLDTAHAEIPALSLTGFLALAAILSALGAVRLFGR